MKQLFCQLVILSVLFLSAYASGDISDEKWLKQTDDIDRLANAALIELKRTSSIHLFDDLHIIRIEESKKSVIAGYSRSLWLKVIINSAHFASGKAEESLELLVLQHKQNQKYSFAVPDFPVMEESFIHSQEEKWAKIHVDERNQHLKKLENEFIVNP